MRWKVPSRDPAFRATALERQSRLTKPTGALGALEDVAVWLADLQQTEQPMADSVAVVVFASDHPVSQLGVSAYPREVTAMMVVNMALGGAAASVLSRLLQQNVSESYLLIFVGCNTLRVIVVKIYQLCISL